MKKILATVVCCFSLLVVSMDADAARRFGGSGSKGRTTSSLFSKAPASQPTKTVDTNAAKSANASATQKTQTQKTATPQSQPSFMKKALTGIAAALGIAALLSLLGIDASSLMGMLASVALMGLIAFAVIALIGMFRKKPSYATSTATSSYTRVRPVVSRNSNAMQSASTAAPTQSQETPVVRGSVLDSLSDFDFANGHLKNQTSMQAIQARIGSDFDATAFIRASKKYYMMFQEAWAKGDITSVADYWDNELYIQMTHELARRKGEVFTVEKINLEAQLLGAQREEKAVQVAVHFTGALRIDGRLEVINDLWVMEKPNHGTGSWLVIGTKSLRN